MILPIGEVARTPGAELVVEFSEPLPASDGFDPIGEAHGRLVARNSGEVLSLSGVVHARVRLACARCLEPFEYAVAAAMEEVGEISSTGLVRNLPDAWPDTTVIDETTQTVNVSELERQSIVAVLPLREFCRTECRGLCPYCGANRNLAPCACVPPRRETPLTHLDRLLARRHPNPDKRA